MIEKKFKILFLSHEIDKIGGSTESLINMINSVRDFVEPIVVIRKEGVVSGKFHKLNITCLIVPFALSITSRKGASRFFSSLPKLIKDIGINFFAIRNLKSSLKNIPIDFVHSNSSVITFGVKLSKTLGAKHVWHLRELLGSTAGFKRSISWYSYAKKLKTTDIILSISSTVTNYYQLNDSNNYVEIYDAVRKRQDYISDNIKKNKILFVGSIIKSKGIETALEAFSAISLIYPELVLFVVGDVEIEYKRQLLAKIEKFKITEKVVFLGFIENVDELMIESKCLMMCSESEGLGRVTIESMFNYCPVVGYSATATKEIIKHNHTGMLFETNEELVSSVLSIIENEENTKKLVLNAFNYANKNFTEEVYSTKLMNVYNNLLKNI